MISGSTRSVISGVLPVCSSMRAATWARRSSGSGIAVVTSTGMRPSASATRSSNECGDRLEVLEPSPVDQHLQQVDGERADAAGEAGNRSLLHAAVHLRVVQYAADVGAGVEHVAEHSEIRGHVSHGPLVGGGLVERLRVGTRDTHAGAAPFCRSSSLRASSTRRR